VIYKVTSRDIPLSASMTAAVEEHIFNLQRFYDRVLRCDVVLSRPHCHHRKTRFHHVRINLKTPRREIIIDREPEKNIRHISFRLALQDAFHTLERRLENEVEKMRDIFRRRSRTQRLARVPIASNE